MSAFIVEDAHIDALVTFATSGQRISMLRNEEDKIGQTLVDENWRSVNYRYKTTDYNDSEAANLIHAIRKKAIREMPGYQEAPWGIDTNSTRSQPKHRLRAVG